MILLGIGEMHLFCSKINVFSRKRLPGDGFYSAKVIFDLANALALNVLELWAKN